MTLIPLPLFKTSQFSSSPFQQNSVVLTLEFRSKLMNKKSPKAEQTCIVKEARIAYTDSGKGFPNVVLLHGFLESKTIWADYVKELSARFRVITIDLPGHGQTEDIGYYHSMELMADVVHGVMHHLGLRRYFMVGHSMGGYVSLAFAQKYPASLKGICLFNSTAMPDDAARKKVRDKAIKVAKKDHLKYVEVTLEGFFSADFRKKNDKKIAALIETAQAISAKGIVACLHGMKDRPGYLDMLAESNLPVLFIAGENDKTVPLESLRLQAGKVPNSTLAVIADCGHIGYLEKPHQCLKALKKFILKNN